jgi:hexosaminidase
MKHRLFASLILGCAATGAAGAQQIALMPMPASVQRADGVLAITPAHGESSFTLAYSASHDARLEAATMRMVEQLDRTCGGEVRRSVLTGQTGAHAADQAATLQIAVASPGESIQGIDEDESYSLKVTPEGAKLSALTDVGAMHAMQTLLQLATNVDGACVLPAITIDDAPRFRWRGLMIDVSRHFEPVDVIKRNLDAMAVAKLNVFHWHLSDDQGFRAESKKFPKLTQIGSGGLFYTQDQMRDVVAYARARGIRVVPEFDMPGHTSSWILAYPELGSGEDIKALPIVYGTPQAELDPSRESTYKFIDAFIGEMSTIFPDAYFHIGGDETAGKGWMANPKIRAFMQKKGFAGPPELQAYFNQRLLPILKKHGKRMIGWDEILNPALPKDIVIQSWRGEASLAAGAKQGYEGILSAPYYLDGEKSSAQMFLDDPVPADTTLTPDQQKLILGGEVCMWAEQLDAETIDSRIWPRTLAIAERFWSPQSDRDVSYMYQRLRPVSLELEDAGVTHILGPEKLRRNLSDTLHPEALDLLASVTEPFAFGDRYDNQHTNGYTSLDRLVDAVVADPPSRQEIAGDVAAIAPRLKLPPDEKGPNRSGDVPAGFVPAKGEAMADLRRQFLAWQREAPQMLELATRTPRLNDIAPLALQLSELGAVGMQALGYLDAHLAPPATWTAHANAVVDQAEKGTALVHFTFLTSLRKLVLAASQQ